MSTLKIFPENWSMDSDVEMGDIFSDETIIARELHAIGVQFESWQTPHDLSDLSTEMEILKAYSPQVDRLKQQHGFSTVDVVNLHENHPDRASLRQKFLSEHTHSDFEVRFFVDGQGLFYLHYGNKVYAVLCKKGTLISVPAGVKHWFDMGAQPSFTCIRLFSDPAGWVAEYTGSQIAEKFPLLEQFEPAVA